jgi:hypothetical protein
MAGTGYDTYRYKAIEEEHGIRLLELHPANYGEPLRCHVISTTLLDAEKVDIRASKFTLTDYGLPPQDDKRWLPVVLLWIRPWFGRLWVMQECVLSERPIIQCGSWAVNWNLPRMLQAIIDVCTSQFRNLVITIPFPQALR